VFYSLNFEATYVRKNTIVLASILLADSAMRHYLGARNLNFKIILVLIVSVGLVNKKKYFSLVTLLTR